MITYLENYYLIKGLNFTVFILMIVTLCIVSENTQAHQSHQIMRDVVITHDLNAPIYYAPPAIRLPAPAQFFNPHYGMRNVPPVNIRIGSPGYGINYNVNSGRVYGRPRCTRPIPYGGYSYNRGRW